MKDSISGRMRTEISGIAMVQKTNISGKGITDRILTAENGWKPIMQDGQKRKAILSPIITMTERVVCGLNRGMMITISDPQTSIILMIMDSFVKSQGRHQEIMEQTQLRRRQPVIQRIRKNRRALHAGRFQTARYDHGIYARW